MASVDIERLRVRHEEQRSRERFKAQQELDRAKAAIADDAERLKESQAKEQERVQRELDNHKAYLSRIAEREQERRQKELDRALKAIERERKQLHQPGVVWFMGLKLWQEHRDLWLIQAGLLLVIGFVFGSLAAVALRINLSLPVHGALTLPVRQTILDPLSDNRTRNHRTLQVDASRER